MVQLPSGTIRFKEHSFRKACFISSNHENRHNIEEKNYGFLRFDNLFIQCIFTECCVECVGDPMMGTNQTGPQSQEI